MSIEVVNFALDRATSSYTRVDLLVGLFEFMFQIVVDLLRLLGSEEALGAKEVFHDTVQVTLTCADL